MYVMDPWNYHSIIYAHTQCRLVLTSDTLTSFCKQTIQCHFEFKQILNTDLQQTAHGEHYICICACVYMYVCV